MRGLWLFLSGRPGGRPVRAGRWAASGMLVSIVVTAAFASTANLRVPPSRAGVSTVDGPDGSGGPAGANAQALIDLTTPAWEEGSASFVSPTVRSTNSPRSTPSDVTVPTPTQTASPTPAGASPTPTAGPSPTPSEAATPTPTAGPSPTPSEAATPTRTPAPTPTHAPTRTPTQTPTDTATPAPTGTATPEPSEASSVLTMFDGDDGTYSFSWSPYTGSADAGPYYYTIRYLPGTSGDPSYPADSYWPGGGESIDSSLTSIVLRAADLQAPGTSLSYRIRLQAIGSTDGAILADTETLTIDVIARADS